MLTPSAMPLFFCWTHRVTTTMRPYIQEADLDLIFYIFHQWSCLICYPSSNHCFCIQYMKIGGWIMQRHGLRKGGGWGGTFLYWGSCFNLHRNLVFLLLYLYHRVWAIGHGASQLSADLMGSDSVTEQSMEQADVLGRKLNSLRGNCGWQGRDFKNDVAAVRQLADCYPQALYSVEIDPN